LFLKYEEDGNFFEEYFPHYCIKSSQGWIMRGQKVVA